MSKPEDRYIGVRPTQKMEHTLPNGRTLEFGLEWNPSNGHVRLRPRGVAGATTILGVHGGDYLNEGNGTFTSLVTDAQIDQNTQTEWKQIIQNSIANAHDQNGGNANGNVLPSWIDPNRPLGGNVDSNNKQNALGANSTKGYTAVKGFSVTEETIIKMAMHGALKYPLDALYGDGGKGREERSGFNQDYVRISQYSYKAPKPSLVGGGKKSGLQIATGGMQRQSPLERFLGLVKLPMPNDITDSNNVAWGQDTMNNFTAAMTSVVGNNLGATAIGAFGGGALGSFFGGTEAGAKFGAWGTILANSGINKKDLTEGTAQSKAGLRAALQSRVLAAAGIQVSAESIMARGLGVIPNANMELLFQAPALREFQFNWKMTPRDEEEAIKVRNIIRFFKQGMAARKVGTDSAAGASSLFLRTPNVFHVQYKTSQQKDSIGVNRIKTCALTSCAMNYTPEGVWSSYEEGQPVASIMSLRFQELEPLYDTDYQGHVHPDRVFVEQENKAGPAQGDLYRIELHEVGY